MVDHRTRYRTCPQRRSLHRSTMAIGEGPSPSTCSKSLLRLGNTREVIAQALSIANEARAAQPASGATMPPLAISDEQPEQNFEIQRNDHANLDQGSAVFTPEGRFREKPQVKESSELYGSTASPKSPAPCRLTSSKHSRGQP